jgi:uncharacterized protein DUF5309
MAVPGGTFQTYQAKGIREDLSDLIDTISPVEFPLYTNAKKGKAKQNKTEWQFDSLDAATNLNASIEGNDTVFNTASPTTRAANFCQTLEKGVVVSGKMRASDTAGREDELTYQLDKRMREIKRDLESSLSQNNKASAGAAGGAAQMAGIEGFITQYITVGDTTTTATTPGIDGSLFYVATAPTDNTANSMAESHLKSVIQTVWNAGGDPKTIMVGGTGKQKLAGFAGVATRFREVAASQQAQIIGGVDTYVSDFGVHAIVPNRFMRTRVALVLDFDHIKVVNLRPFRMEKLGKTGDADKYHIVGDYSLQVTNPAAMGKVCDVDFAK